MLNHGLVDKAQAGVRSAMLPTRTEDRAAVMQSLINTVQRQKTDEGLITVLNPEK